MSEIPALFLTKAIITIVGLVNFHNFPEIKVSKVKLNSFQLVGHGTQL